MPRDVRACACAGEERDGTVRPEAFIRQTPASARPFTAHIGAKRAWPCDGRPNGPAWVDVFGVALDSHVRCGVQVQRHGADVSRPLSRLCSLRHDLLPHYS
jgi:hypothetical protein